MESALHWAMEFVSQKRMKSNNYSSLPPASVQSSSATVTSDPSTLLSAANSDQAPAMALHAPHHGAAGKLQKSSLLAPQITRTVVLDEPLARGRSSIVRLAGEHICREGRLSCLLGERGGGEQAQKECAHESKKSADQWNGREFQRKRDVVFVRSLCEGVCSRPNPPAQCTTHQPPPHRPHGRHHGRRARQARGDLPDAAERRRLRHW